MSATDLTLAELRAEVLLELKSVSTSQAYTATLIDKLLNEGYQAVYNQPKRNVYPREKTGEFMTIPDDSVDGTITAGDTTVTLNDASNFPSSGRVLIGEDIVDYTGKSGNDLTGCTGVDQTRTDSPKVRFMYPISTYLSGIDEQQIRFILLNEQKYEPVSFEHMLNAFNYDTYKYAISEGYLILSTNTAAQRVMAQYFLALTPMSGDNDTPSLLPNTFRRMLVFYATGRALILDDERTGWDKYYNYNSQRPERSSGLFFEWLRNFYGKYSRRVDENIRHSRSVYD
jgi:hypothetical protein